MKYLLVCLLFLFTSCLNPFTREQDLKNLQSMYPNKIIYNNYKQYVVEIDSTTVLYINTNYYPYDIKILKKL